MTKTLILVAGSLLFIGACFILGNYLARRMAPKKKKRLRNPSTKTFPLSAFSQVDHPAMGGEQEEVNPLSEAEVYMVYGKHDLAQKVLDTGLKNGQIDRAAINAFWAKHGPARVSD